MKSESKSLEFGWRCPSNIAFVKYWGKKENQIPRNTSLSMTLSNSYTETKLRLIEKQSKTPIEVSYNFEGKANRKFEEKVLKYIENQKDTFSFLNDYSLSFESKNSFPHSTGIASSASAFGSIALALLDAERFLLGEKIEQMEFYQKASKLSRLGSGSACRSIYGGFTVWGQTSSFPNSSDLFAIPVPNIHENFLNLQDAILIVDDSPKAVSSSVGHSLMNNHPYAQERFKQANSRASELINILQDGDYDRFIQIVESEALTLHAMMMTSSNYYLLMKANTIITIEKIWAFRRETKIPICFTLDAGPNLHVIYPRNHQVVVNEFLKNNFNSCTKQIIFDESGLGPNKIL